MAAPARPPAVRPSGWWYLAPVLGVVLGLVLGGISLRDGFREAQAAGFDAALAGPGETQLLTIGEPGSYTVAYTGPVVVFDEGDQRALAQELAISITPVEGDAPLALAPYEGLNSFEQDGDQYVPLLTVRFEEAGDYSFVSGSRADLDPERSRLVVLESPWRKLRDGATQAVAVVVVAVALAVLVTVILARTRGRAKRAARAASPWTGGYGGGYGPGSGGPPPAPGPGVPPGGYGPGPGGPPGGYGPPPAPGSGPPPGWGAPPGRW